MVFAAMFRQKNREEGREEGIAQGRDETNAAWREWNRRRLEAETRGELFSEPTPDSRNGSADDDSSPNRRENRFATCQLVPRRLS